MTKTEISKRFPQPSQAELQRLATLAREGDTSDRANVKRVRVTQIPKGKSDRSKGGWMKGNPRQRGGHVRKDNKKQ
jgi:hypothetical protein